MKIQNCRNRTAPTTNSGKIKESHPTLVNNFRRTLLKRLRAERNIAYGSTIAELYAAAANRDLFAMIRTEWERQEWVMSSSRQYEGSSFARIPPMTAHTAGVIGRHIDVDGKKLILTFASVNSLLNVVRQQQRAQWLGYTDATKDATYKLLRDKRTRYITSNCHDYNGHAHLVSITLCVAESRYNLSQPASLNYFLKVLSTSADYYFATTAERIAIHTLCRMSRLPFLVDGVGTFPIQACSRAHPSIGCAVDMQRSRELWGTRAVPAVSILEEEFDDTVVETANLRFSSECFGNRDDSAMQFDTFFYWGQVSNGESLYLKILGDWSPAIHNGMHAALCMQPYLIPSLFEWGAMCICFVTFLMP